MMYSIFMLQVIILSSFMEFIRCECEKTASNDGCCQDHWKQNNTCVACPPGKIGLGCDSQCPENFYGTLCKLACNCTENQICDKEFGCVEANFSTYVCPLGKIGLGCDSPCPENFYGTLCKLACNCTENQICDKEIGCVEANFSSYGTTTEDAPTFKLSIIYWSSLACFVIVMLIVISVTVFLVVKRKHPDPESAENENEHRNGNNSSVEDVSEVNDHIECANDYEDCANDYEECVNNDYEECTNDYLELDHLYSTIGI